MIPAVSDPFTIVANTADDQLKQIGEKILRKERISIDDGVVLFEKGSLSWLGALANWVREQKHGNKTYFNRNFRILLQILFLFKIICPSRRRLGIEH
jgi:aminodeoxyfutalosine synthase